MTGTVGMPISLHKLNYKRLVRYDYILWLQMVNIVNMGFGPDMSG